MLVLFVCVLELFRGLDTLSGEATIDVSGGPSGEGLKRKNLLPWERTCIPIEQRPLFRRPSGWERITQVTKKVVSLVQI